MDRKHLYLAAVLTLCTPTFAQNTDGPYWNSLPLPGKLVTLPSVIGSIATLQTSTRLHLYSAVLRKWAVLPISSRAKVYAVYNDYVIVHDGSKVHAYATRTGKIVTINVSSAAVVHPGPPARGWVAAVQDGKTVYGFSGFLGAWVPLTTAHASPTITVGGNTILVGDGLKAYAFSMIHGNWVSTPAKYAWQVKGKVALALGNTAQSSVLAYSGFTNKWTGNAFPQPVSSNLTLQKGFALLHKGTRVLAYSAYTGTFTPYSATSAPGDLRSGPNVAVFRDGNVKVVGYAPGTASFTTLIARPASTLTAFGRIYGSIALVTAGSNKLLYGFSGITGRFTSALPGTFTITMSQVAAFAQGSTASFAYSPILDTWVKAPSVPFTSIKVINTGVVLQHPSGFEAFSIRSGRWTSNHVKPGTVQTQGSMFANTTGNRVDVFDDRLDRWTNITTKSAPQVSLWRMVAIVADSSQAYGYSLMHGSWDKVALKGSVKAVMANSEIGYVLTSTHIHVFTAFGTFSPIFTFPEFWRAQPRGTSMRQLQLGKPGSAALSLFGLRPTRTTIPPLGTLFVDPASIVAIQILGIIPASGLLDLSFPIPADRSLNGLQVHIQNLIVDPKNPASARLTNSITPIIW